MKKIRYGMIAMWLLLCPAVYAEAGINIGIGLPNLSIGINLPLFPELVPVPGYPVYYAPRVDTNYFFYDGMYWVYQDDNWYASSWYNGPWAFVDPDSVPLFILRIPVRYYVRPPVYFRGWHSHAPPRWGQHWGRGWEQHRGGWDRWDRGTAPRRAPLPVYQRQYSRDRYPGVEQQHSLRSRQYRYQPRDRVVRQHFQQPVDQRMAPPAQRGRQNVQEMRNPRQQAAPPRQQVVPPRQGGSPDQRLQQQRQPYTQRGPAPQQQRQLQQPAPAPREQQPQRVYDQRPRQQERGGQDFGKDRRQWQDDDRGRGRDRNN